MTKTKAAKCTTHHYCDCTAYRLEQMELALKIIRTWASVPGALVPEHVLKLVNKTMGTGGTP